MKITKKSTMPEQSKILYPFLQNVRILNNTNTKKSFVDLKRKQIM